MNPQTYKIVLVVQDLETKDGEKIAIVSGDVHYHRDLKEKLAYETLASQVKAEKDLDKKNVLDIELLKHKHVASFQMSLDSNKEFQRHIKSLAAEAISLKEKK
jgi:hypothetical protein